MAVQRTVHTMQKSNFNFKRQANDVFKCAAAVELLRKQLKRKTKKNKNKITILDPSDQQVYRSKDCTYTPRHSRWSLFCIIYKMTLSERDTDYMVVICFRWDCNIRNIRCWSLLSRTRHHEVWIVLPLAIQPLALYFLKCTLNCCQGKWLKYIFCCIASVR